MRVDRRNEMLFLSLQDEARGLEIEEAKGCYCIECLVIVIETFWARKCNKNKLDFIEKLKEISNKLHKYIIDIKPKEHEKNWVDKSAIKIKNKFLFINFLLNYFDSLNSFIKEFSNSFSIDE